MQLGGDEGEGFQKVGVRQVALRRQRRGVGSNPALDGDVLRHDLPVIELHRVGAALGMKGEDVSVQNRRLWVRLHEKGGKRHEMPCHHSLETYLNAYLDGCDLRRDPRGPLFRTIGRGRGVLSARQLPQANAHAMIGRRAGAVSIATKIGNHTFGATGITAYLNNGGTLENATVMAIHASTRTNQLYDRRSDQVGLDEIERVRI